MMQLVTLILMVLAAAFSRLIPHPWGFTAVGAMALFGGAFFSSKKLSMLIPLMALFVSDLVLGFHSTILYVYGAFAIVVVLGWNLRSEQKSIFQISTFSLASSLIFFTISNFGVWMVEGLYAPTWQGLVQCYVAAIPFLAKQIYGDLFFSGVLFGGYAVVKNWFPKLALPIKKH